MKEYPRLVNHITYLMIIFILCFSYWIRFSGISFGFPLITHPDEPVIVNAILNMQNTGDLNPHNFLYPSLYIYMQYIVLKIVMMIYKIQHAQPSIVTIYYWGRFLTICLSVATVYLVFLTGRLLFKSRLSGIFASLAISVSYLHITNSYMITTDSPMAFWVVLSFYLSSLMYVKGTKWFYYLLNGICVGCAIGTKYTALWCVIPFIYAHLYHNGFAIKSLIMKRLWLGLIIIPVIFFCTTPYAILDFKNFYSFIEKQGNAYSKGWEGYESTGNTSYLLYFNAILFKYGIIYLILTAVSSLALAVKDVKKFVFVSVFPCVYFLFFGAYKTFFDRNMVVLIPFLSLLLGSGIMIISSQLNKDTVKKFKIIMASVFIVLLGIGGTGQAIKSVDHIKDITLPNTRLISKIWIESNLPYGVRIGREHYTPPLDNKKYRVSYLGLFGLLRADVTNFDYFIASSKDYARFFDNEELYPEQARRYNYLFNEHKLIKVLSPQSKKTSGPVIRIYKVRKQR
jgi:4-amino-4-deoxy-L-arabinose transferase-like glycosyltransferase